MNKAILSHFLSIGSPDRSRRLHKFQQPEEQSNCVFQNSWSKILCRSTVQFSLVLAYQEFPYEKHGKGLSKNKS